MKPPSFDLPAAGVWEAHAGSYAERATALTEPFARDVLHAIAPTLAAPTTRLVLDVGCGGGAFALAYLTRFPRGVAGQTVRCTDISPGMVAAAQAAVERRTQGTGCLTTFEFAVEDATALANVADRSVHALVSVFGVFLVPQTDKVFEQIRRVLATDVPSVFAATAWTDLPPTMSNFGMEMQTVAMTAMKLCHPEREKKPEEAGDATNDEKDGGEEGWERWGSADGAKQIVTTGGLGDARVWRSIHTLCTGDRDGLWTTMTTASPMVDLSYRTAPEIYELKQKFFQAIQFEVRADDDAVFLVAAANIVTARLVV